MYNTVRINMLIFYSLASLDYLVAESCPLKSRFNESAFYIPFSISVVKLIQNSITWFKILLS